METTRLIKSSLGQCPVVCQRALGVHPLLRPWPFVCDPSPSLHYSWVPFQWTHSMIPRILPIFVITSSSPLYSHPDVYFTVAKIWGKNMYLFCYFFSSFELYIRESLWREINEALGVSEMGISPCGILSCWTHSYTLFLVPTSTLKGGRKRFLLCF